MYICVSDTYIVRSIQCWFSVKQKKYDPTKFDVFNHPNFQKMTFVNHVAWKSEKSGKTVEFELIFPTLV